jgi:hypothetical protein
VRLSQAWWFTPIISALGRLGQEDHEFKGSHSCLAPSAYACLPFCFLLLQRNYEGLIRSLQNHEPKETILYAN